jgi:glycosyltransferase involved in cell wall biosynthesis
LKVVHSKYRSIPIVLAGREGKDSASLLSRIKKHDLDRWVFKTGYLNDSELREIYRSATVFVFPSFCEGFGLPLLEAMASGTPIVASRTAALPEVCQDAALFIDPEQPESMAEVIIRVLKDTDLREELIRKGKRRILDFSWESTAKQTLSIYRSMLEAP